jgi:serine protease AprX
VDGRGVRIAIIDQPLNRDHREIVRPLLSYNEVGGTGFSIQMHGAPVASIAVGTTCGVAPAAELHYFAMPTWKADNAPCCDAVQGIIQSNDGYAPEERIRIVSISTGMFSKWSNYERWRETLEHAGERGILILTCAGERIAHGMLARQPGKLADEPTSYSGLYGATADAVLVPAGNRTTASHEGPDVYTYWTDGGLSWATPYLAGVAALAWQVDPSLTDSEVATLIRDSATQTDAGLIVDPPGLVSAIRERGLP